jgi:hypothetical protein
VIIALFVEGFNPKLCPLKDSFGIFIFLFCAENPKRNLGSGFSLLICHANLKVFFNYLPLYEANIGYAISYVLKGGERIMTSRPNIALKSAISK